MSVDCARTNDTMKCLTCNAFREAGNDASIVEVNRTVIARAESGKFPTSLCSVVYQRSQFSWTTSPQTCTTQAAWAKARKAAEQALKKGSNKKMNFYANYIYPSWARNCGGKQKVGTHIFCNVGNANVANSKWRQEPAVVALLGGTASPTVLATAASVAPSLPARSPRATAVASAAPRRRELAPPFTYFSSGFIMSDSVR